MEIFRDALLKFLLDELDIAGLEQAVDQELTQGTATGDALAAHIQELYASGRLSHQVFAYNSWMCRRMNATRPAPSANESS